MIKYPFFKRGGGLKDKNFLSFVKEKEFLEGLVEVYSTCSKMAVHASSY